jgi:hypothetical protein
MTEDVRIRVMSVLLKSVYKQNLISEDVYNHSLDNLPKVLDYSEKLGCDAVKNEVGTGGCL